MAPAPPFQGPVRPGDDPNVFRTTGRTQPGRIQGPRRPPGGGGGGGGSRNRSRDNENVSTPTSSATKTEAPLRLSPAQLRELGRNTGVIRKLPRESQAAFNARLESVGRIVAATNDPRDIRSFFDTNISVAERLQTDAPRQAQNQRQDRKFLVRDPKGKIVDIRLADLVVKPLEKLVSVGERVSRPLFDRLDKQAETRTESPKGLQARFSLVTKLLSSSSPVSARDVALGALFAPAFAKTLASQESQFVFDNVAGKFVTKEQAKRIAARRFAEAIRKSKDVKVVKGGKPGLITEADLRAGTRAAINNNIDNPAKLKRLKKFYDDSGRGDLFADIFEQELGGTIPDIVKLESPPRTPSRSDLLRTDLPKIVSPEGRAESTLSGRGAQFERTSEVEVALRKPFSSSQPSLERKRQLIKEAEFQLRSSLQNSGLSEAQINQQVTRQKQQLIQKLNQPQSSAQRQQQRQLQLQLRSSLQNSGLSQSQINQQVTRQRQQLVQRLNQPQSSAQRQPQLLSQPSATALRNQLRLRQEQRFGRPTGRPPRFKLKPRFRIPPLLRRKGEAFSKRIKTEVTGRTPKYDVIVRKKGKFRSIRTVAGRQKALDFLAFRLDNTLRASGFVRPSNKKAKPIPKSITGYLSRNRQKFRPGKNNPSLLVEKRRFRLEKGGVETRRINQLKRMAKPFRKRIK